MLARVVEIESSDVDVDHLAERVARAAELIQLCRTKISAAQLRIEAVTADHVQDVSRRYLAPGAMTAVVVGDAGVVEEQLAALGPLTVRRDVEA